MKNWYFRVFFLAIGLVSVGAASVIATTDDEVLSLRLSISKGAVPEFVFSVTNNTNKALYLKEAEAPWRSIYRCLFIFTKGDGEILDERLLRSQIVVDEAPIGVSVKIGPHVTIQRRASVFGYYSKLASLVAVSDVYVYWGVTLQYFTHDPYEYNDQCLSSRPISLYSRRFGGFISMEKIGKP